MKQEVFLQIDADVVITDLVNDTREAVEWGSTVGIVFTAGAMAIVLIRFLFFRD